MRALATRSLLAAGLALALASAGCGQEDSASVSAVEALIGDIVAADGEAACDRVAFFGDDVSPVGPNCAATVVKFGQGSGLDDEAVHISASAEPCDGPDELDAVQVDLANGSRVCVGVGTVDGQPVINAGDLPSLMTFGAEPAGG